MLTFCRARPKRYEATLQHWKYTQALRQLLEERKPNQA